MWFCSCAPSCWQFCGKGHNTIELMPDFYAPTFKFKTVYSSPTIISACSRVRLVVYNKYSGRGRRENYFRPELHERLILQRRPHNALHNRKFVKLHYFQPWPLNVYGTTKLLRHSRTESKKWPDKGKLKVLKVLRRLTGQIRRHASKHMETNE